MHLKRSLDEIAYENKMAWITSSKQVFPSFWTDEDKISGDDLKNIEKKQKEESLEALDRDDQSEIAL